MLGGNGVGGCLSSSASPGRAGLQAGSAEPRWPDRRHPRPPWWRWASTGSSWSGGGGEHIVNKIINKTNFKFAPAAHNGLQGLFFCSNEQN